MQTRSVPRVARTFNPRTALEEPVRRTSRRRGLGVLNVKMSGNSSSNLPLDQLIVCFTSDVSLVLFWSMLVTNLLLLPVFVLVLYLGFQQWRQECSTSLAASGPSDLFTYHAIAMQISTVLGFVLLFHGASRGLLQIMVMGLSCLTVTSTGQLLFHILTCVEHYLAVLRPVTYLHLKQAGEAELRHACAGCVWLLSVGWLLVHVVASSHFSFIVYCFAIVFSLSVICFCSISVLCALRRPAPGEGGGSRARADQSKRRAFYTILTFLAVLLFGFVGNVTLNVISSSTPGPCVPFLCTFWVNLPSNLVLPVLFLHRAAQVKYHKQKSESGRELDQTLPD